MGFVFKQEPTAQEKHIDFLQTKITKLESEVTQLNEFLELIGKAHIYDAWLAGEITPQKDSSEGTYAEVIE